MLAGRCRCLVVRLCATDKMELPSTVHMSERGIVLSWRSTGVRPWEVGRSQRRSSWSQCSLVLQAIAANQLSMHSSQTVNTN